MIIELRERTEETVITYFNMTRDPEVRRYLPQKAVSAEEALADFRQTQLPGAASYGRTIYADGAHAGDIWCYGICREEPNAMVSYCIFDKRLWNKGIAAESLKRFLAEIKQKFQLKTVGAFTFSENRASVKVLMKNGFTEKETFSENGVESIYFQRDL